MVGIEVDSYCCGNCDLIYEGHCSIDNREVSESSSPCNLIHEHFVDRGYTFKFQKIDFFPPQDTKLEVKDADKDN